MKKVVDALGSSAMPGSCSTHPAEAQDYRARVQGAVVDESRARCPASR